MAKPFVKWVGGKGKLLEEIKKRMPLDYNTVIEPFVGGGSLFLSLDTSSFIINDLNKNLINVYLQIKNNYKKVIEILEKYQKNFNNMVSEEEKAKYYYYLRSLFNNNINNSLDNLTEMDASLFIFLNKTCFNGLYRVNREGLFNVPFGKKINISTYDEQNLSIISTKLKNTMILNDDFENACKNLQPKDFVFFDSPYYDTFVSYQKDGFNEDEHIRLSQLFHSLTQQGVYCMLTNSNNDYIKNLYSKYNINVVNTYHCVNRNGNDRKREEIIITNY